MMDKISCEIIQDLLPLYKENMANQDTRKLVEEHIAQCPDCASSLKKMKEELPAPADMNAAPLFSLRRKLRYNKARLMLLTILFAVTMVVLGIVHMTSPIYLSYDKSLISFKEYEDGSVLVTLSPEVSGYDVTRIYPDWGVSDDKYDYHITLYNTLWSKYQKDKKSTCFILNSDGSNGYYNVRGVYYYSDNGNNTVSSLIYGTNDTSGGCVILPRLVLNYYKLMALVLTVIGTAVCLSLKKKLRALGAGIRITLLPAAYFISTLCVTGFSATTYSAEKDFTGILLVMIPLYLVLITAAGLIERKKPLI